MFGEGAGKEGSVAAIRALVAQWRTQSVDWSSECKYPVDICWQMNKMTLITQQKHNSYYCLEHLLWTRLNTFHILPQ